MPVILFAIPRYTGNESSPLQPLRQLLFLSFSSPLSMTALSSGFMIEDTAGVVESEKSLGKFSSRAPLSPLFMPELEKRAYFFLG